jgi:hypothetical protein
MNEYPLLREDSMQKIVPIIAPMMGDVLPGQPWVIPELCCFAAAEPLNFEGACCLFGKNTNYSYP